MDNPVNVVLLTLAALVVVKFLFLALVTGGQFSRIGLAWKALKEGAFEEKPKDKKPSGEPVRLLAVLQRDGRLIDFLLEDIEGLADDQIGSAVRDIHRKSRKCLQDHLVIEPIQPGDEGQTVDIAAGFDPSAIQLTGNVTGQPPFRGALRHPGWRVKEIKLAPAPQGQD